MAARKKVNTTKKEIIQVAMRMFLENGFSNTSVKAISDELEISTGNLTFHYPTKEHLLAVLVRLLCDFQWDTMEHVKGEGASSLLALSLELPMMAAMCDENAVTKDFYMSAYTLPMTLNIIRVSDMAKAKSVFAEFCPGWTNEHFAEAEVLASGIEYATLMTTELSPALEVRVAGALNTILGIYWVPEAQRREVISQVVEKDYRGIGRRLLAEFHDYVCSLSEEKLERLLLQKK